MKGLLFVPEEYFKNFQGCLNAYASSDKKAEIENPDH